MWISSAYAGFRVMPTVRQAGRLERGPRHTAVLPRASVTLRTWRWTRVRVRTRFGVALTAERPSAAHTAAQRVEEQMRAERLALLRASPAEDRQLAERTLIVPLVTATPSISPLTAIGQLESRAVSRYLARGPVSLAAIEAHFRQRRDAGPGSCTSYTIASPGRRITSARADTSARPRFVVGQYVGTSTTASQPRLSRWAGACAWNATASTQFLRGLPRSSTFPARIAQVCLLDELDHLPVSDEITLCLRRVGEEAAGDHQLTSIGFCRLLGNPGPFDPPLSNQAYSRPNLRAGAITESLEHAATDLELVLWIDFAHSHMILSQPNGFGKQQHDHRCLIQMSHASPRGGRPCPPHTQCTLRRRRPPPADWPPRPRRQPRETWERSTFSKNHVGIGGGDSDPLAPLEESFDRIIVVNSKVALCPARRPCR